MMDFSAKDTEDAKIQCGTVHPMASVLVFGVFSGKIIQPLRNPWP
jgi:hypothetical protein